MARLKLIAVSFSLLALSFLLVSPAMAAYRLILKNGSVLEGIESYERQAGELKFQYAGGTIGVPEKEVLRIEKYTEELPPVQYVPTPAAKTETPQAVPAGHPNAARLAAIDRRLAEIQSKEEEYKKLKAQYQEVMLRIQNLFNLGRQAAIRAGKSQLQANQQYNLYLGPAQQQMVQTNFLTKQELEAKIKDMETNILPPLEQEKARLLQEKKELEGEG
ncbi:MAG: hypothetical protein M0Z58_00240 [Nitrospiraceae bacterium]|nr:hypothetical protein [Nitrospiraceae bacterium]